MDDGPPGDVPGDVAPERGRGHRRRRTARRTAVQILYQSDVTERPPSEVIRDWQASGRSLQPYTIELVRGVEENRSDVDRLLGRHAEGWAVHRMAVLDRTILRVACHELRAGVPPAVAISEAVEAAGQLSTEDSARFVNGVLGRIAREVPPDGPS